MSTYIGVTQSGAVIVSAQLPMGMTAQEQKRFNRLPESQRRAIAGRALAGSSGRGIAAAARDAATPAEHPGVRKVYDRLSAFRSQQAGAPAAMHRALDRLMAAHLRRRPERAKDTRTPDDQVCFDSAADPLMIAHAAGLAKANDAAHSRWLERYRKYGTSVEGLLPL